MNIFGNLWTRRQKQKEIPPPKRCSHSSLVPHWDRVEDMGHNERADFFICDSCAQIFSQDEASAMRHV